MGCSKARALNAVLSALACRQSSGTRLAHTCSHPVCGTPPIPQSRRTAPAARPHLQVPLLARAELYTQLAHTLLVFLRLAELFVQRGGCAHLLQPGLVRAGLRAWLRESSPESHPNHDWEAAMTTVEAERSALRQKVFVPWLTTKKLGRRMRKV